jgi:hypothetical protein
MVANLVQSRSARRRLTSEHGTDCPSSPQMMWHNSGCPPVSFWLFCCRRSTSPHSRCPCRLYFNCWPSSGSFLAHRIQVGTPTLTGAFTWLNEMASSDLGLGQGWVSSNVLDSKLNWPSCLSLGRQWFYCKRLDAAQSSFQICSTCFAVAMNTDKRYASDSHTTWGGSATQLLTGLASLRLEF